MSPPVFVKHCACSHTDTRTAEISPSDSNALLSSANFDRGVDLHRFLCNPIYKPTGKERKQCSSSGVHGGAWWAPVMGLSTRLTSLLPLACLLGIPLREALASGSEQLVSKFKKTYSRNLGGAQLYISCGVTKTGGKFRLTSVFQRTLGFSFVCVIVVAKSTAPMGTVWKLFLL